MAQLLQFAARYGPRAVAAVKKNWKKVTKWVRDGMSFSWIMDKLGF